LRSPHHDALGRFFLGRLLRQQGEVAVDLAKLGLDAQRQLAALRFQRADLALLRHPLPFGALNLGTQTEQLFGLGLRLRG
jgi:hypothetical protein